MFSREGRSHGREARQCLFAHVWGERINYEEQKAKEAPLDFAALRWSEPSYDENAGSNRENEPSPEGKFTRDSDERHESGLLTLSAHRKKERIKGRQRDQGSRDPARKRLRDPL